MKTKFSSMRSSWSKAARLGFASAGCAAFAIASATSASAEGISAGTLIENTASATYNDGGGPRTVSSNTVSIQVDELLNVTVTAQDAAPLTVGPGEVVFAFEVTNQGNGPEAFDLVANPSVAGNDFDAAIEAIAIDSNGNGTYDPGVDQILPAPASTGVLAADERVTVFVIATIDGDIEDAAESQIDLTATAATGSGAAGTEFAGEGESGGDAIVGATGASAIASGQMVAGIADLSLVKAVAILDPFGEENAVPGAIATFTITASIEGTGNLEDLVIIDPIPEGTTYVPASLRLDGAALSDAAGDDAGSASDADGIAVDLGNAPTGSVYAITFDVTIN